MTNFFAALEYLAETGTPAEALSSVRRIVIGDREFCAETPNTYRVVLRLSKPRREGSTITVQPKTHSGGRIYAVPVQP